MQPQNEDREFYDLTSLEHVTGIPRSTWALWIRKGKLQAMKIGRRTCIEAAAWRAFIDRAKSDGLTASR
jgi:hypothetical protein